MGSQLITPDPGTVIWTVITFLCLAALLAKFAWKPLLTTLEERERTIRESIEQAQKARAEAEETLRKNQEILAQARRETALIIEQGKREAESMRGEILAQARKEAQDLVEQGKRQVQYEQKQAIEQLRRQVADLAIQAAERLISRSLDDTKQRELLDDYVRGLTALEPRETHR
ncbi:MAG: ATP synthase F0 subunit B [Acidobacteria bacterium]|nr:MAG: ATP synthase F0 subunit B [Acidobacteria bacterium 13_1_40CM_2_68_10]PYT35006.1 MAG: ATP synthase F0 subunit B [Acidobacteriota bacterium]